MICTLISLYVAMLATAGSSSHDSAFMPVGLINRFGVSGHGAERRYGGSSAEEAACRRFVGEFYAWYIAHSKHQVPLDLALKRKRANFSAELVRRLNEDRAASAKSPGEIVGLEFDPVLNSQDLAEKYVPDKVTE